MGKALKTKRTTLEVPEQRAERITVRRVLNEVFQKVTQLDFKVFRTIGQLCTRPGQMVRSYVQEKRERYSNPFAFAFATVTLYIALNSLIASEMERFFDPLTSYRAFWPYAMFLLMVPAVALQKLLFRKSGYNFAETYTFALFMAGQLALFHTLLLPLELLPDVGWWQNGPMLVVQALYFAWAVTGFVGSSKLSVWARGLLSFAAYGGIVVGTIWALVSYMWSGIAG
jgi:hypothetical protein